MLPRDEIATSRVPSPSKTSPIRSIFHSPRSPTRRTSRSQKTRKNGRRERGGSGVAAAVAAAAVAVKLIGRFRSAARSVSPLHATMNRMRTSCNPTCSKLRPVKRSVRKKRKNSGRAAAGADVEDGDADPKERNGPRSESRQR
jgi:hypothetical protein